MKAERTTFRQVNLGKDPVFKEYTDKNKKLSYVDVYVGKTEGREDNSKDQKNWVTVQAWNEKADFLKAMKKGEQLTVTGVLKQTEYKGKVSEVIVADRLHLHRKDIQLDNIEVRQVLEQKKTETGTLISHITGLIRNKIEGSDKEKVTGVDAFVYHKIPNPTLDSIKPGDIIQLKGVNELIIQNDKDPYYKIHSKEENFKLVQKNYSAEKKQSNSNEITM